MKIEDYIELVEVSRINFLFTPVKNEKIRGLTASFFKFKIPLEATNGRSDVKALAIIPLVGQPEKLITALIWEALFGKKFKVCHWMILFQMFLRTISKTRESEALLTILYLITAQAGLSRWNSNMKPLKTMLSKNLGEQLSEEFLQDILKNLSFKLPHRSPDIDKHFRIDHNAVIKQSTPAEQRRIGVGYKDKGSLRKETGVEPESFTFEETEQMFDLLLRRIKMKYPNFH